MLVGLMDLHALQRSPINHPQWCLLCSDLQMIITAQMAGNDTIWPTGCCLQDKNGHAQANLMNRWRVAQTQLLLDHK